MLTWSKNYYRIGIKIVIDENGGEVHFLTNKECIWRTWLSNWILVQKKAKLNSTFIDDLFFVIYWMRWPESKAEGICSVTKLNLLGQINLICDPFKFKIFWGFSFTVLLSISFIFGWVTKSVSYCLQIFIHIWIWWLVTKWINCIYSFKFLSTYTWEFPFQISDNCSQNEQQFIICLTF